MSHRIGDDDLIRPGAAEEGVGSDVGELFGDVDLCKGLATAESIFTDIGDRIGECNGGEIAVSPKGSAVDLYNRVGNGHRLDILIPRSVHRAADGGDGDSVTMGGEDQIRVGTVCAVNGVSAVGVADVLHPLGGIGRGQNGGRFSLTCAGKELEGGVYRIFDAVNGEDLGYTVIAGGHDPVDRGGDRTGPLDVTFFRAQMGKAFFREGVQGRDLIPCSV